MTSINIDNRWLFKRITFHKKQLLIANIIAIFATALSVPIPLLMPLLVDEVLLDNPASGIKLLNLVMFDTWQTPLGYIIMVTLLVVLMRIASQALNIYQTRQFTLISKSLTCYLRKHLLDKVGNISMQQYEQLGSGTLTAHLVTDIETVDKFIGSTLSRFVVAILTTLGIAAVLFWIDWKLALLIVLLNPLIVYLSRRMGDRVKKLKKLENKSFERFQQRLVETLDGIYQLRAANRDREYLQRLKNDADQIRSDSNNFAWQSDAANRLSFLMFLAGFEIFRAVAVVLVLMGDLSIGQIFAVFGYLWFMLSPIQDLLNIQYAWFSAKAAIKRLNKILNLQEEVNMLPSVFPFTEGESFNVEFRNVNFSYDQERKVLDNLNIMLPKGKRVALVGASGGGKSTLIQLLMGIYQKQSGEILIDGHAIEQVGYSELRSKVAAVLQQPMIFNDTLRENLTLGADHRDDALYNALEIAQLSSLLETLPDGLSSQLGRQGVRLSGGQRQRVAIARMILSNPELVILDEATSALDSATEATLHHALDKFLVNKSTLIIAHRLSAVKHADLIYVLEDGKVVQSGDHQTLVNESGLYQTLYGNLQHI